ncbi:DUF6248 family natural product biosynthesis protein [Streptacidiphilus carbonis]|uniref:DUF6248 family natural product biosynthesis protein n=1 Tax=Streptacidiphilus carbonis TaxID=105422 RepID=UPI0005A93AE1|nr:DUF6248 family natural product biosynthesis protein [Streptacidiphilus carbonis]
MNETMSTTARPVIRRPQRTLTAEERELVRDIPLLNLQAALIMGIVDPVPNASPMGENEGAWVREQVWPGHHQVIEAKYPFGFRRWANCERGTCWNCLSGRCDLCVHRQKCGPDVDDNTDQVHNAQGVAVAQVLLRLDDAPCAWWCRCPCPKDGPLPVESAPPVAAEAGPAKADSGRQTEGGSARAGRRRARAAEPADQTQGALF